MIVEVALERKTNRQINKKQTENKNTQRHKHIKQTNKQINKNNPKARKQKHQLQEQGIGGADGRAHTRRKMTGMGKKKKINIDQEEKLKVLIQREREKGKYRSSEEKEMKIKLPRQKLCR